MLIVSTFPRHLDPGAGVVPRQVLEDAVLAEAAVQPRRDVPLGEAHRVLSLLFYHGGDAAQSSAPVRLTGDVVHTNHSNCKISFIAGKHRISDEANLAYS